MKRTIPVLVVVGLAVVVALLLINRDDDAPPDTLADATTTTSMVTTTVPDPTTTTSTGSSTTTANEVDVVETVEEAEAILRELWFGWFEGIYNEDEDRIREVVGSPDLVQAALDQFGVMEFDAAPTREALSLSDTEILLATEDCLAIWSVVDASPIVGAMNDGVHVFLGDGGKWLFISQWANRDDLWEADCQSQLPS